MEQKIIKNYYSSSEEFCLNVEIFLCKKFNVDNISLLHNSKYSPSEILNEKNDTKTNFHKVIYSAFDTEEGEQMIASYRNLCKEWLFELINKYQVKEWAIQRFPNIRFQVPENISVFEFHKDSTYNHPLGEINHFLAINECKKSASLHIERNLGWEDYKPLNLSPRESAIINTSIFKHGDYKNKEGYTRVSADFRAIPQHVLENQETNPSMDTNRCFSINDFKLAILSEVKLPST